jgi:small subunit ribosomal protein S19e
MVNIFDVSQRELLEELAKELQQIQDCKPPEWAAFVKTGHFRERPPTNENWWYLRTASVLKQIYKKGPIGVSKLRTFYGGKKNRGAKPEKFFKASGNIIRKILQQLEKAQLAKQVEKGVHKGRVITPKGRSLVDKAAKRLIKVSPKEDGQPGRDKEKKT